MEYCRGYEPSSFSKNSTTATDSVSSAANIKKNNNSGGGTSSNCVREPWRYGCGAFFGAGDSISSSSSFAAGLPWPPRSYTCSFCKREFRSAQALGGHMNVHRRDRARLREYSPPWDAPPSPTDRSTPNPNPNPSSHCSDPNPRRDPIPNLNHAPDPSGVDTKDKSPPGKVSSQTATFRFPEMLPPRANFTSSPPLANYSKPYFSSVHGNPKPSKAMKALFGTDGVEQAGGTRDEAKRKEAVVQLELEIGMRGSCVDEELDLELRLGYA